MNRLPVRSLLAVATLAFAATALVPAQEPAATTQARRVALLVGIDKYDRRNFPDLRWAEHDVQEMGDELSRLGFDKIVIMKGSSQGELRPTTRDAIKTQLLKLLKDFQKTDVVLVMLCGHGQQLKVRAPDGSEREDGFFCPVGAVVNEPATMLSLSTLTDEWLAPWGGRNLVLVDACRDGVVDRDRGVRSRGIEGRVVALPEDTAILFSCRAGQKSDERDALKHGVFAYSVLEAVRAEAAGRAVTWGALVNHVQNRVAELNPAQEPIAAGAVPRIVLGRGRTSPAVSITSSATGITLRLIPAGTFLMGSTDEDQDSEPDEKPQHEVRISAFYLSVTEVTRGQFRRFVAATGYKTEAEKDGKGGWGWNEDAKDFEQNPKYNWLNPGFEQTDEHPVVNVSWNDAVAFCDWLSRTEGQTYRLPTEAEWEYACRARTTTKYFSGDDPESLAVVGNVADETAKAKFPDWTWAIQARDGFVCTAPVGQFRPNAFGLYDLHGNVWEWCRDGYDPDYYKQSPGVDPQGPPHAPDRVDRGGGWGSGPRFTRSADRSKSAPDDRDVYLGFRLARAQSSR
jgi:formylglycine-generating enzyme required for sulfatase activity